MKKIIYLLFCASLLSACVEEDAIIKEDHLISECLLSKNYNYEDLLTKADISKHVAIAESSYKIKISSIKGEHGSCLHEWASDRPDLEAELLGQIIKQPDKNRVTLRRLHFYSDDEVKLYSQSSALTLFDQAYKKLSQDEYNKLLANLEKEYAGNPSGYETAKKFLDQRMQFTYEPVNDLGTRAYWKWHSEYGVELVVLTGAARFTIESKTSGDKNTAFRHAVKFAEEVLAKCEK